MNNDTWASLYQVVCSRRANPQEGSYTCYLFEQGLDKILKKTKEFRRNWKWNFNINLCWNCCRIAFCSSRHMAINICKWSN